jgi:hypothetical protein
MRHDLLLCELHAHTTWSDGVLTTAELVDLYGTAGFDVLCVTDDTARLDDPRTRTVDGWSWSRYIHELEREAERALAEYDLLLIPGLGFSDNQPDPDDSAHVLALGLRQFVSVDHGIVHAILGARAEGAAIVGAHPYCSDDWTASRPTRRLHRERDLFRSIIDRWELANRKELFTWVAEERLPVVATGDFRERSDLASWKTLVPCRKSVQAVIMHLRSAAPVYVTPFTPEQTLEPLAA